MKQMNKTWEEVYYSMLQQWVHMLIIGVKGFINIFRHNIDECLVKNHVLVSEREKNVFISFFIKIEKLFLNLK